MAFREQRHGQEDRRGGSGKRDADLGIAVGAEAPLQGRAHIAESGKVGRPFGWARQGRPFGAGLFQPSPVVGGVARGQVGELGVVDGDFEGVGARRVQEPVAHHGADGTDRDHRLGDEAVDGAKDRRSIQGRACHDFQRRIERKVPNKYRESAKHHALQFGEELVAPVECGLQCLLAWRRCARPEPQQCQMLIEKRGGLLQAVGFNTPGGQLNRERDTVKLSADAGDNGCFHICDV
jgi:hypothetical protein